MVSDLIFRFPGQQHQLNAAAVRSPKINKGQNLHSRCTQAKNTELTAIPSNR